MKLFLLYPKYPPETEAKMFSCSASVRYGPVLFISERKLANYCKKMGYVLGNYNWLDIPKTLIKDMNQKLRKTEEKIRRLQDD
jgi:hypothetical protein